MIFSRIRPAILPRFLCFSSPWPKGFSTSSALWAKQMPPRPSVAEDEIVEVFLKGSGPGGQKINKTASAVQLKHLPTGLVVKSQATRSREQNRKTARNLLAMKLEERFKGDDSRAVKLREKASKRKASKTKKAKRKYIKLKVEKVAAASEQVNDSDGDCEAGVTDTKSESTIEILGHLDGITNPTSETTMETSIKEPLRKNPRRRLVTVHRD